MIIILIFNTKKTEDPEPLRGGREGGGFNSGDCFKDIINRCYQIIKLL